MLQTVRLMFNHICIFYRKLEINLVASSNFRNCLESIQSQTQIMDQSKALSLPMGYAYGKVTQFKQTENQVDFANIPFEMQK